MTTHIIARLKPELTLGGRLRFEREQRGLTVEQVATALKILPRQLHALEAEDYSALPEPIFVRGYVRCYAKLLDLSADELLLGFDDTYQAATGLAPSAALERNPIRILGDIDRVTVQLPPIRWGVWLATGVFVAIVSLLLWQLWFSHQTASSEASSTSQTQTIALPNTSSTLAQTDALELRFAQNSQVVIKDANGQVLMQGDKQSGEVLTLQGASPFSIELTPATGVRLTLNGHFIDISPYIVNGAANFRLSR